MSVVAIASHGFIDSAYLWVYGVFTCIPRALPVPAAPRLTRSSVDRRRRLPLLLLLLPLGVHISLQVMEVIAKRVPRLLIPPHAFPPPVLVLIKALRFLTPADAGLHCSG